MLRRLLLAVGLILFAPGAMALENSLKAAFLYKFADYVDWPAEAFPTPEAPITIAVVDDDIVAERLAEMTVGRTAQGRPIAVRRLPAGQPVADAHILFIGNDAADRLGALAQSVAGRPVLLVTDSEDALQRGSMINFVLADRRLRFEVALDAVERNGLRLSSRLLAVALDVRRRMP
ncbi:MAG: YfiR family protein [Gammaproteobacteria bacterium]